MKTLKTPFDKQITKLQITTTLRRVSYYLLICAALYTAFDSASEIELNPYYLMAKTV